MKQDEERQLCETYYSRAIAGTTSDEEELTVALDLLEKAQHGFVVDDSGKGLLYVSEPDLPVDADYLIEDESTGQRLRRALPAIAALALGLVAMLFLYGDWGKRKQPVPTPTTTAVIHLPTMTLTPTPTTPVTETPTETPTITPTPMPTDTPTPAPPKEVAVKPEPVKLDADAVVPVSLEIAGRYFPVVPTTLRDETWAYLPDPDRISWLAGSYVNVVLGLPYTEENLDLVATTLALSDTLTLRTNVAGTNVYRVVERTSVAVYEIEPLGQRRAGLTLVLLGGNEEASNEGSDRRFIVWAIPVEIEIGN